MNVRIPNLPNGTTAAKWYSLGFFEGLLVSGIFLFFENIPTLIVSLFFPYKDMPIWLILIIGFFIGCIFLWIATLIINFFVSGKPEGKIKSKWFLAGYATGSSFLIFGIIRFMTRAGYSLLIPNATATDWLMMVMMGVLAVGSGIIIGHGIFAPLGSFIDDLLGRADN